MSAQTGPVCPLPHNRHARVLLAHGGGGRLGQRLLEDLIFPAFANPALERRLDAAVLDAPSRRLAMTTDTYVVRPLVFPGGDIGSMAVFGTVNDLAMVGARPLAITCGFVLEEGLPLEMLERVVNSIRRAADMCGVSVVAGDTKVVERGKCDQLFLNTTGLGVIEHGLEIGPASVCEGDRVLLSGDLGRHGMAIMAAREGLGFESEIESDCAPVHRMVLELLDSGISIRCMRDLTRGGLAAAANELAATGGFQIELDQRAIAVREDVHAACELLGLDPLHVANEGRFAVIVPEEQAGQALAILRRVDPQAAVAGAVVGGAGAPVVLVGPLGAKRILDVPSGEQLPRIC